MEAVGFVVFLALFFIAYSRKIYVKAKRRTGKWAVENDWKLESFRQTLGGGRGYNHYRFVVSDKQGAKKTGVVKYISSPINVGEPEIDWIENLDK